MGATETVDLFLELINDDRREKAVELFAENAVLGISVPACSPTRAGTWAPATSPM